MVVWSLDLPKDVSVVRVEQVIIGPPPATTTFTICRGPQLVFPPRALDTLNPPLLLLLFGVTSYADMPAFTVF